MDSPRISELANHWRGAPRAGLPELGGEFRITDLFSAMNKHPPDLIPSGWPGAEPCSELRVIDNTPLTAAGQLAAIRIQRHTDPLDHFPGLFPAWDYTDLRRRFTARFD
ncbi:hypothetical protein ACQUSR_31650 [Streptomyces sp. P1-3]|uniref:hypothetical protein n=1 Tax=Streptomyces sp. P1-3 TaxID=3421658 RepID=UPI003D36B7C2